MAPHTYLVALGNSHLTCLPHEIALLSLLFSGFKAVNIPKFNIGTSLF